MPGLRTPQRERLSARTRHAGGCQGGSSHAGVLRCRRRRRPRRSRRPRRRRRLWCCLGLRSAAASGQVVRGPALAGRPPSLTLTLTPTLIQTLALAQARAVTRSGSAARSSHQERGHQERGQHERAHHLLRSEGVVEGELGRRVQEQLARLRSSCGQQRQRQQPPPPPQRQQQPQPQQMLAKERDLSATTSPVSSRSDSASPVTLPGGSGSDRSVSDSAASDRSCSARSGSGRMAP